MIELRSRIDLPGLAHQGIAVLAGWQIFGALPGEVRLIGKTLLK